MKKFSIALMGILLLALLASCNKSNQPSDVASNFYKAIIEKDFSKAVSFTNLDTADYDEGAAFIEMVMSDLGEDPFANAVDQSIDDGDSTAKVKMNLCFYGDTATIDVDMVLKEGQWKVRFI